MLNADTTTPVKVLKQFRTAYCAEFKDLCDPPNLFEVLGVLGTVSGGPGAVQAGKEAIRGIPALLRALFGGVNAAKVNIGKATYAQKSFSETFSKGGLFAGQTIDDVARALRSKTLSPKDVPVNVIVRDGNTLILNTRSAQALTRAGIRRESWNVINRTGDDFFEGLLTGQLTRNGLNSGGYTFSGPR